MVLSLLMDSTSAKEKSIAIQQSLSPEQRLHHFMQAVSGRALIMMESACRGQQDIAADLVQETFISLYEHYPNHPIEEWYPLFYTILNNKLNDWRRKEARRQQRFGWLRINQPHREDDTEEIEIADVQQIEPSLALTQDFTFEEIRQAIQTLPLRQQQAFMLRAWEEFDTATTAQIMKCSVGSVKTHYHRAIQALKIYLAHLDDSEE